MNTINCRSSIASYNMDSAIRLCQSPLPIAPSIGAATARASRVHLSLSHGSLSVSHRSKRSHLVSRLLLVNCMLDRFSEGSKNEENGKNIARGMGGVSLVLACALGAFTLSSKMNPKPNVAYAFGLWGPETPTTVKQKGSGRPVLDSLQQLISKRDIRSRGSTRKAYFEKEPAPFEVEALKLYAMALSKYGDPIEAESILRDECRKWEASQSSVDLTMALIELLLDQKKYQEASKQLDKLIEELSPMEPLREEIFLHKAVVESILDRGEEAKCWEEFRTASKQSPRNVVKYKK